MDKELEERIKRGNKRMAIVSVIMATILAIPMFVLLDWSSQYEYGATLLVYSWMIVLIIYMTQILKIVNYFWKD